MTTKVFIAGSIAIKRLAPQVRQRIDKIVSQDFEVVVGDANGVDRSVQDHLSSLSQPVRATVFCSGESPRNNIGAWPVETVSADGASRSRAFYSAKDRRMAEVADYGLMIWDAESTGTLSNVIELLSRGKKSVVFLDKEGTFHTVSGVDQLEKLIERMDAPARRRAEQKIGLAHRLRSLRQQRLLND